MPTIDDVNVDVIFKWISDAINFHPRAWKLMRKHKEFIVVAYDEPYFMQVYKLIRDAELAKGTWTDVDEYNYQFYSDYHAVQE
jgi:hypothetical protein